MNPAAILFCLLPSSRWRVLYFKTRPQSFFNCVVWGHRFAVMSGVERSQPWIYRGKQVLFGRFVPTTNKVLEGDLSQNAASGKATAFASTNELGLAKSG